MVVPVDNDSHTLGDSFCPIQWLGELTVLERLGKHSYRVLAPDPRTVGVARAIVLPGERSTDPAEMVHRAAALIGPPDPALVPVLGIGWRRGRAWLVSPADPGLDILRFLDVVKPSAAEALLLCYDMLCCLGRLHSRGRAHTRVHPGNVLVGADGVARLSDWAVPEIPPGAPWTDTMSADLAGAAAVVARLNTAARCPAGARSEAAKSLNSLPRQLQADSASASLGGIVTSVGIALGDEVDKEDLRESIAVLLAAATRRGDQRGGAFVDDAPDVALDGVAGPRSQPRTAGRARPAPHGSGSGLVHRATRSLWGFVVAVAVLGLVVGAEIKFLHGPISSNLRALNGGTATKSAPTQTVPDPPVASVPAGGPVKEVDVRSVYTCSVGHQCLARVLVGLAPHSRPVTVAWDIELFNHCSASSETAGRGISTVPAGASQMVHLQDIALPGWPSLEMSVHLTVPETAYSAPYPVPASPPRC